MEFERDFSRYHDLLGLATLVVTAGFHIYKGYMGESPVFHESITQPEQVARMVMAAMTLLDLGGTILRLGRLYAGSPENKYFDIHILVSAVNVLANTANRTIVIR